MKLWPRYNALDRICCIAHNKLVPWEVEFTDEFESWWNVLDEGEQEKLSVSVLKLGEFGPGLGFPDTSDVKQSRHPRMRELRVQIHGNPFRVLYAFDPRRVAMLLIGGDKTGDDRWYDTYVPVADNLYDQHLVVIAKEKPDREGSS